MSASVSPKSSGLRLSRFRAIRGRLTTPVRLWAAVLAVWLTVVFAGWAVLAGVRDLRGGLQTVGYDSAPSIMAAQQIKTDLAGLHYQAARTLLDDPGAAAVYEQRRQAVTDGVLDAAMNITYGEAEKQPIRRLLNGLGEYEEGVGEARVLHVRRDAGALERFRVADDRLQSGLLPAADALDRANFEQLTRSYQAQQSAWRWAVARVVLAGLALLGALLGAQWYLARRTRRFVSPALAAATVLVVAGLLWALVAFTRQSAALKRAKEDAFDSVHALMLARADAQGAAGDTLRALLDPAHAAEQKQAFEARVARLAKLPAGMSASDLQAAVARGQVPAGFEGYLADELRNITFPGEDAAARKTLTAYLRCVEVERAAIARAEAWDTKSALRLALGPGDDTAAGACARFDQALGETLDINRREFRQSIDGGFAALSGFDWACPLGLFAVAALAFAGVRPRLREYAAS